ncbi:MAG: ABC transporter ATP-binding protein [Beijerinckiaceae bacterium]
MSAPLLAVDNLTTRFRTRVGDVMAVNDVSFHVEAGEIVGLVGESGSGKSVLGFSLLGLIDPPGEISSGSVRWQGRELRGLSQGAMRSVRGREIAMIFQDPAATLNPVLTIADQMRLAVEAHEKLSAAAARQRAVASLATVGIPDPEKRIDNYPHQFSGGMRQRVAIATALLNRPRLLICDEPTTALDVSIQAQILTEMRALAQQSGTAMIWISHDLATVSMLASRLLVMYAGRVIESGPVQAVLRTPRHPYTRGLMNSLPANAAPGEPLRQIPGSTPALVNLPPGCAFAPRCSRADSVCTVMPAITNDAGRSFRCHHPLQDGDVA